ncbi:MULTISPECIES: TRAP transporter substrate-binding protein [unclassified Rubrivivax]|uniref:TRAP transporter substrate-binding protein n=1 Tax=unclassified Rubrivivax TaxID=2649762 RepID=UPI001E43A7DF|nr:MULTISPECIES: TRAP transporter substrate-binding protein [unclassified Rubrivivax]MCC9598490.1 TRAP transporter substrate-binding protein [Rubrivivax sp. JA1055]MCC9648190.1 TRAP transporter substrate-binding protein [Rubrivivax sp. JA1029]
MQTPDTLRRLLARALIAAPLLAAAALPAAAQEIRDQSFKFAFVQPKDSHMGAGAVRFAELVAAKSKGLMQIRLFPGGTLGGDIQTISALQGGTVEMTTMPPGLMVGLSKPFAVFDMPFLFNSFAEADALLDGPVGQKLMAQAPAGLVGLAYWDHGFRNVSNSRRPVARLEDFAGLKIRVSQSPMIIETINGLGANATPMAFTEVYSALETRAVDGQENPTAVFDANKFNEVQKYLSLTRHQYNPLIVLASGKAWARLNDAERRVLTEAAVETRAYQRQVSREMEAKSTASLKARGTLVNEVSAAEIERMRRHLAPVSAKLAKDIGEALVGEVTAEVERLREAK